MTDRLDGVAAAQERVGEFLAENDLDAPPAYRLLDAHSELGELAKEVAESTDYGADPDAVAVAEDELGDALFALLAFADAVDVDGGEALATAIEKYEGRIEESGTPASDAAAPSTDRPRGPGVETRERE